MSSIYIAMWLVPGELGTVSRRGPGSDPELLTQLRPRPALMLLLALAACVQEAKDDKVCDVGGKTRRSGG